MERALTPILRRQAAAIAAHLRGRTTKLAKVDQGDIDALRQAAAEHPYDEAIREELEAALAAYYAEAQRAALQQMADAAGVSDADLGQMLSQVDERAVAWARNRVGNLVTEVSDTTRGEINRLVADAIEAGSTNEELAAQFEDAYGFSRERGLVIARTETNFAESQGSLAGYKASGVAAGKYWAADAEACELCEANAAVGVIPLDESFPSGDDAPPGHPNCECSLGATVRAGILTG